MKKIVLLLLLAYAATAQMRPMTPSGSGSAGVAACVGAPGSTSGADLSQCLGTDNNLYVCNKSGGCAVAADWANVSGAFPSNLGLINAKAAPYNALGNGVVKTDGIVGAANYTFTFNGSADPTGYVLEYSGVNPSIPIDPGGSAVVGGTGTGVTTLTFPAITTTVNGDQVVRAMGWGTAGTFTAPTPPPAQREFLTLATNQFGVFGGDQTVATAGSVASVNATYSVSVSYTAMSFALQPAGAPAIALVASSTAPTGNALGTSLTLPRPAGSVAGNIDIVCFTYVGSTGITSKPLGATLILNEANGSGAQKTACYWMPSTSTDPTDLTSPSASFTSADPTKLICAQYANTTQLDLCTTIASVVSPTEIKLASGNASGNPIPAAEFVYATNDDAAIAAAVAAGCGTGVYFPPGLYGVTAQITPCSTGGFILKGSGVGMIDWNQVNWSIVVTGNQPTTALAFLTNSLSSGTAGISFGSAILTATEQVSSQRFYWELSDIGVLAGIGGNSDGGGSTANGIVFQSTNRLLIKNVWEAGFGQDGLQLNGVWIATIQNAIFTTNGRNGLLAVGNAAYASGGQNILLQSSLIDNNYKAGVSIANSGVQQPIELLNNSIWGNNRSATSGGCEISVQQLIPGQVTVIGNWIEKFYTNTVPFCATTGMANALIAGNTYAQTYTNVPALTSGGGGTSGAVQANSVDGSGSYLVGTTVSTGSVVLTFGIPFGASMPCAAFDVTTPSVAVKCTMGGTSNGVTLTLAAYPAGSAGNFNASDLITWQLPYGH